MGNLEKAQEINRIILKKIHEVCKKNEVTYFLDSGALIGAVRHKGFIPWDDDVDVAFTRDEYEKFLAIPESEWGPEFQVVTYDRTAPGGFFDFVTRVIYLGDTVPTKCYQKAGSRLDKICENRVAVDCLVMDSAYDSNLRQKLLRGRLFFIYGQLMGHREYIDYSEYSLIQKFVIYILSHIGRHRSLENLYGKYEKVSRSVPSDTKHMYYSNYPMHLIWVRLEKDWFKGTVQLPIGEEWYDAPMGFHKVLKAQYNDYMSLPEEEKRVPQHIVIGEEQ